MNNTTSLFLGAYWHSRKESRAACARRARDYFSAIARSGDPFTSWYELGESRRDALRRKARIDDLSYWQILLDQGRHRTDYGKKVMHDLGFSIALWNGGLDESTIGVRIHCGDYSPFTINCVAISGPAVQESATKMIDVLRATVDIWQPDWAGVMSTAAMDVREYDARRPFVDWMTYVCDKWLPDPPVLAAPSIVKRVPGGTLIVVQEVPPVVDNLEDQRHVRRVQAALQDCLTIERKE